MKINGIEIIKDYIPKDNVTSRPGLPLIPEYITVHNTGNPNENANARMHTEYVDNTDRYVSWHFSVDDISIYQELPLDEVAWHAGDGHNGPGNRKSLAIEICETGDYAKAEENAIALIRYLMEQFNIPLSKVVPHRHWSGKYCPHIILDYGWDKFIERVGVMTWEQKNKEFVKRFQTATGLTPVDGLAGNDTNTMFDSVESFLSDFVKQKGNYPRIELNQKDGIKFVEIDPLTMEYVDLSREPKKVKDIPYKNFANGPFFFAGGRPIWLVVSKGKKVHDLKPWDYLLKPKGTFIVYNDGRVEVKTLHSIKDVSNIHLAFQGFNLNYEANGSKSMLESIRKESYGEDAYRACWRNGYGYVYKTGKVILARVNGTAEDLRQAMRKLGCVDKNGNTCGVGPDSGSRHGVVVNGEVVGDGGNYQEHIIKF
ncbi:MAG: N-acetylmuramoyl-L-alanine amidase [Sphaerochaeta sp.]|jgi:N-acetylmuramoyl-L-alanine amidase|nr:N-acetylmuramoyl-L-alanine amidase [Sphaerochaeta sp.]